jgi:polysaccharide export outer membrane protein
MRAAIHAIGLAFAVSVLAGSTAAAQRTTPAAPARPAPAPTAKPGAPAPAPVAVKLPDDYVIGPEDVIIVQFWQDDTISGETTVRPDGKITLRLLNDIQAAGLTTDQLRQSVEAAALKCCLTEPTATVAVKVINSRKVFITGEVGKGGPYAINGPMSVMQLITTAGGVTEYAKRDKILIHRTENGKKQALKFNYEQVLEGKKLEQDILLKPGDLVTVP